MTDNEIIEAWEKCSNPSNDCYGDDYTCEYSKYDKGTEKCFKQLRKDITDLIKRLQAKNKELDEKLIIQKGLIDIQKAEIERLQKHNELVLENCNRYIKESDKANNQRFLEAIEAVKSEARKELAERLKKELSYVPHLSFTGDKVIDVDDIDSFIKEMEKKNV